MATRAPGFNIRVPQGEFAGSFSISGNVYTDGTPDVPVERRVRLYDRHTGDLVRETWSDRVTGAYSFSFLPADKSFVVLAIDHTNYYNAVVADNITPE